MDGKRARIERLERERRALVRNRIEDATASAEERITGSVETVLACGATAITIDVAGEGNGLERITVVGVGALWPEWGRTGADAVMEWMAEDGESDHRLDISFDGTASETDEGIVSWIERSRAEGAHVYPTLDLGGRLGRTLRALAGGGAHGACPTIEMRVQTQRRVASNVTEVGAVAFGLALDPESRDHRDRIDGDGEREDNGCGCGVAVEWRERPDPQSPAQARPQGIAERIARRSPVRATVNGARVRREAVPAGARHVQAVTFQGGTVWAWRTGREEDQRQGSLRRIGVRERACDLPVLSQDRRKAGATGDGREPRKVIARCISVRSGDEDREGEHNAAVEALARVAESMMKDEEPMLLDAASLRLAWSGGTARAYRYTRLVMYEALRGEQAVELIEHAGTSKADRPAWQMCAAIDDTIVRVAAIAEDADAQTMAAMLAVQREARRAGTDLRLVERTDAFGRYEATRDAMVIERARAETRLRNGNPMDTPRGERSGGRRRLVQLGEGEKIIVKLEMRPNEDEETTTEEVEVREHVWAAPSWTRARESADLDPCLTMTHGSARPEEVEATTQLLCDSVVYLYPEIAWETGHAHDALRLTAERAHNDEGGLRRAKIAQLLAYEGAGSRTMRGPLLEGERLIAERDAESGTVRVKLEEIGGSEEKQGP